MTGDRSGAFRRIADRVASRNPLQAKHLAGLVPRMAAEELAFAEETASVLSATLLALDADLDRFVESYDRMCRDFLKEQVRFQQTGRYSAASAEASNEAVYQRPEVMQAYMEGLLLSYLFWPNHSAMLAFFRRGLPVEAPARFLEVAPGHGLFSALVLRRFPSAEATLLDISATSLDLARRVLPAFAPGASNVSFVAGDFLAAETEGPFPLVVMGELLEHVDEPRRPLRRAAELVRPGGRLFLTTCANCPAVDHVFHFRSVASIRGLIAHEGSFSIEEDLALPVDPVPPDRWEEERVTVNYAAWLTRDGAVP